MPGEHGHRSGAELATCKTLGLLVCLCAALTELTRQPFDVSPAMSLFP